MRKKQQKTSSSSQPQALDQDNASDKQLRNYFILVYKMNSPQDLVEIGDGILWYEEGSFQKAIECLEKAKANVSKGICYIKK